MGPKTSANVLSSLAGSSESFPVGSCLGEALQCVCLIRFFIYLLIGYAHVHFFPMSSKASLATMGHRDYDGSLGLQKKFGYKSKFVGTKACKMDPDGPCSRLRAPIGMGGQ